MANFANSLALLLTSIDKTCSFNVLLIRSDSLGANLACISHHRAFRQMDSVIDPVGFRANWSHTWFASPIGASINQEWFLTRARFPLLLQSTRLPRKQKSRGAVVSLISDWGCNLILLLSQHGHHKWKDS